MKKMMLLAVLALVLIPSAGYCQDSQNLFAVASSLYTGSEGAGNNLFAGFSAWGLIGGILFSGVGFVAFVYGKRNCEFRPLVLGILLLGYPFFIRNTTAIFVVGAVLTAALFLWHD